MTFLSSLFGHSNIIYIHTDKQQYYAGELVTGTVILSVVNPLHVDGIYIKLSGFEEALFEVRKSRTVKDPDAPKDSNATKTEYYTVLVRDNNTFFKRRYCIYSQKCTLANGNFVFPFQFHLEAKLPGTFSIYNNNRHSNHFAASVSYSVEAEVAIPGMLTPNLRHSQDILIHEPLRTALMGTDTFKETKVTFLCCISKGIVTLSANIDKNAYGPGEMVQLRVIIDNSASQVDLEKVSLKLVQSLKARARGEHYSSSCTVAKAESPSIKAGERADRFIQLMLPRDTEPSTKSSLIDCSYELTVVLKVPWSPDVVVRQPVQIFAPQVPTYVATLQYPQGWNPTVMAASDLEKMHYTSF